MAGDEVLDVLIIGGGFTGISAARELDKLGVKFELLDAFTDHLGGRAYAYSPSEGSTVHYDHGAEYIGDLQNDIMQLIRQELPPDALINGANLRHPYPYQVMVLDGKRHQFRLDQSLFGITGIPPDVGLGAVIGLIGLLAELTLIEIQIDVLEPWNAPDHLLALDKINTWDWLLEKKWVNATARDLLRISLEALLSVEPSLISPYYIMWYCACNSGLINEVNDDAGGPQQYWLKGGMSSLAEAFAKPIKDRIRQGVRVKKIDLTGDLVKVTTDSGEVRTAKKVLVAMSPHTSGKIHYTPEPVPARRALMDMPMGKTLKCQIFYKSSWWHDVDGVGYNGYCGGANNPVLWVMDNSPPPGVDDSLHVLMTFTVGAQFDALGPNPSHELVVSTVTGAIRDFFKDDRALAGSAEFIRLVSYSWSPEGFIGGGPNTVFTPGALTGDPGKMMNQHWDDKVFFASAENARNLTPIAKGPKWNLFNPDNSPKYTDDGILKPDTKPPFATNYSDWRQSLGYMDGGIVSGRYVAHEIADSLGKEHGLTASRKAVQALPPAAHVPLAAPVAHGPEHVLGMFEKLKTKVDAATGAEIRSFQSKGASPGGFASWLHDAMMDVLDGSGGGDPVKRLTLVRDFAAAAVPHLEHDDHGEPTLRDKIRKIVADTEAALKKKLG